MSASTSGDGQTPGRQNKRDGREGGKPWSFKMVFPEKPVLRSCTQCVQAHRKCTERTPGQKCQLCKRRGEPCSDESLQGATNPETERSSIDAYPPPPARPQQWAVEVTDSDPDLLPLPEPLGAEPVPTMADIPGEAQTSEYHPYMYMYANPGDLGHTASTAQGSNHFVYPEPPSFPTNQEADAFHGYERPAEPQTDPVDSNMATESGREGPTEDDDKGDESEDQDKADEGDDADDEEEEEEEEKDEKEEDWNGSRSPWSGKPIGNSWQ